MPIVYQCVYMHAGTSVCVCVCVCVCVKITTTTTSRTTTTPPPLCLSKAWMPCAGGVVHVIHSDTSPTYSPVLSYAPYLLALQLFPLTFPAVCARGGGD